MSNQSASIAGQFCIPHSAPVVRPVFRDSDTILIDRAGAPIPTGRCFKCNCSAEHEVRKTFASNGGLLRFLVLIQPLLIPFVLPFYLSRHKRVSVAFGLCDKCRERRQLGITIGVILMITSVPFFVFGALTLLTVGPLMGSAGAALLGAGILTICYSRHLADSKHVDDRWIVLRGGGKPFLEAIPQANLAKAA